MNIYLILPYFILLSLYKNLHFYILGNKENYSLDEIESKLALIYVQKNVDFESVDGVKENEANEADPITTFSLDDNTDAGIADPFIEALREANELL